MLAIALSTDDHDSKYFSIFRPNLRVAEPNCALNLVRKRKFECKLNLFHIIFFNFRDLGLELFRDHIAVNTFWLFFFTKKETIDESMVTLMVK